MRSTNSTAIPKTRYHFGADWGFANDPTVLIRCYTKDRTLYVDREAYAIGCEIDRTPALFDQIEMAKRVSGASSLIAHGPKRSRT